MNAFKQSVARKNRNTAKKTMTLSNQQNLLLQCLNEFQFTTIEYLC